MLLWLLACTAGSQDSGNTYKLDDVYCDTLDEDGLSEFVDGGATGLSGKLEAQLISDYSDDPREISVIRGAYYVLENIDKQGGETPGNASGTGKIDTILGSEGMWSIEITGEHGCAAEFEFEIQAEMTLKRCVLLSCNN